MVTNDKQIAALFTAIPYRLSNHHRLYQENVCVTDPNPFARRPGGWLKPFLGSKLGRLGRRPVTENVKVRKTNPFPAHAWTQLRMRFKCAKRQEPTYGRFIAHKKNRRITATVGIRM